VVVEVVVGQLSSSLPSKQSLNHVKIHSEKIARVKSEC